MPWFERSPNFPAEASCMLIVHITRWKDVWVPCRDTRKSPRPPLHLKNGPNMSLTTRKPRGVHCFKFWRCLTIFNIVRNPNIRVSNRKRDLNSYLTSRSVSIFLLRLVYIPELSLIPRQVPDFKEQTRVSNGHPRCNSWIYPNSCRNSRKPMRLSPRCEMRPDSPALCPEQLLCPNQTRKEPRFAWLNSRESPTTLSQDEKNTAVTPGMQNCSVYPKSNWDEANFPCNISITTPRSKSYRTSGLTPFRNL